MNSNKYIDYVMYYLFIIRSNNSDYYIYIIIYSVKYYLVVYLNYNSMRSINVLYEYTYFNLSYHQYMWIMFRSISVSLPVTRYFTRHQQSRFPEILKSEFTSPVQSQWYSTYIFLQQQNWNFMQITIWNYSYHILLVKVFSFNQ